MTKTADGVRSWNRTTGVDRILSRMRVDDAGCWRWTYYINGDGYARLGDTEAHRISYELFVGEIPDGLLIDHLCRVRDCVNPAHLEAVTRGENALRGNTVTAENAAKTRCLRGHAFDNVNTWVDRHGRRNCRACHRLRQNERNRLKRSSTVSP